MIDHATAPPLPHDEKDAAWHAERRTGLGGSDVAALLGLDPYKSAFAVFLEKTGQAPPVDLSENEHVEWGNILEEPVGRKFARKTGLKIARVNKVIRHPYFPWAIAHIDYRIVGVKEGLEVKTAGYWAARSDDWGESGTDVIPANYMCQVQWYMGVTNWKRWHVAALIGGSQFRDYVIERDDDFIAELFARGADMLADVGGGAREVSDVDPQTDRGDGRNRARRAGVREVERRREGRGRRARWPVRANRRLHGRV
jgi:putative phage-type endonuclease